MVFLCVFFFCSSVALSLCVLLSFDKNKTEKKPPIWFVIFVSLWRAIRIISMLVWFYSIPKHTAITLRKNSRQPTKFYLNQTNSPRFCVIIENCWILSDSTNKLMQWFQYQMEWRCMFTIGTFLNHSLLTSLWISKIFQFDSNAR